MSDRNKQIPYLENFLTYLKFERAYAENTISAYKKDILQFALFQPLDDLKIINTLLSIIL